MVKNYVSFIFFSIVLFSSSAVFSQSYRTVIFKGQVSDFTPAEKISGSDGVDYYVTFSETTMYFGAFNVNPNGQFNPYDHFTIYLDTDPQPETATGAGSTAGVYWDNQTPQLPFNADHRFAIRYHEKGESWHHQHDSSGWFDTKQSQVRHTTNNALEIAVDLSAIGNPKGIYFTMFMSYGGSGGGFFGYNNNNPNYPISFNGSTSTGYFGGLGLFGEGILPTQITNIPILHSLTNTNPTAGGKYAHLQFDNGHYSVNGNIEIVPGGTTTIAPGSALTVDGTLTNNGTVSLESTSTSYSSLITTAADGSGEYFYSRHVNTAAEAGASDLISPPFTGQTFGAFAANNPNIYYNPNVVEQKLFGPFDKTIGEYLTYFTNDPEDAAAILAPANGYRAASEVVAPSTSGGQFVFTGAMNTGTVSTNIENTANSFGKWNLIGNPFPSYLKVKEFLTTNQSALDDAFIAIYGYNGSANTNKWEILNKTSSALMAPGQGFFVVSKNAESTINFDPGLRSVGTGDDFIPNRGTAVNNDEEAKFTLKLANATQNFTTEIFFSHEGTLGLNPGYDAGVYGGIAPAFSIYSQLVKDNQGIDIGIQTLPYTLLSGDNEVVVPIGIKATQGQQLTISGIHAAAPRTIPANVDIYFDDNVAQTSTLLNDGNYVFTPDLDLSGMGRFSLRFSSRSLNIEDSSFEGVQLYSRLNSGQLVVKGEVKEVSVLDVYDINGRKLIDFTIKANQAVQTFDITSLSTGIYIVKLKNNTRTQVKKIQINQ